MHLTNLNDSSNGVRYGQFQIDTPTGTHISGLDNPIRATIEVVGLIVLDSDRLVAFAACLFLLRTAS
jgi:hypothetical protein